MQGRMSLASRNMAAYRRRAAARWALGRSRPPGLVKDRRLPSPKRMGHEPPVPCSWPPFLRARANAWRVAADCLPLDTFGEDVVRGVFLPAPNVSFGMVISFVQVGYSDTDAAAARAPRFFPSLNTATLPRYDRPALRPRPAPGRSAAPCRPA